MIETRKKERVKPLVVGAISGTSPSMNALHQHTNTLDILAYGLGRRPIPVGMVAAQKIHQFRGHNMNMATSWPSLVLAPPKPNAQTPSP